MPSTFRCGTVSLAKCDNHPVMPRKPQTGGRRNPLNLFAEAARARAERHAPLAARMRPRTLEEFVGQEHLVGQGRALRRAIEEDRLPSMVLWGPPGSGKTTLARTTTENPSFEVISPLLSRSRVFKLNPLTPEQIEGLLRNAQADQERGLGSMRIEIADDTLAALAGVVGGDARIALNALELASQTAPPDAKGARQVTVERVEEALQHRAALYDRAGDWHYDIISAFIKSLRGSDPDGALYWLARPPG